MVFGKEVMVADPKSSGIMGIMGPMGGGGGGPVPVRQPNYVTNLYRRVITDSQSSSTYSQKSTPTTRITLRYIENRLAMNGDCGCITPVAFLIQNHLDSRDKVL